MLLYRLSSRFLPPGDIFAGFAKVGSENPDESCAVCTVALYVWLECLSDLPTAAE